MLLIIQLQSLFYLFFFCAWSFYESFICFQFHHSILICHILFFFNLVLIHLISNFFHWSFCKTFGFQFHSSIQIYSILFFPIWLSFFWVFFCLFVEVIFLFNFTIQFFLGIFVKLLLIFNFIIQFKFIVYYFFRFGCHSFEFFFCLFVEVIFLFNFTLQLRICNFSLIYFLFWFLYPFF